MKGFPASLYSLRLHEQLMASQLPNFRFSQVNPKQLFQTYKVCLFVLLPDSLTMSLASMLNWN